VTAPLDWWKSFFEGLAVDFWGAAIPPEATAEDAAFLWKHLALWPGARVLDVPCGLGRLARVFAGRGCAMTGVDISERALAAARENAGASAHDGIRYRRAEMRDLPWPGEFDAAFCFGNSFGYLDDDGNWEFLRAVSRTLRPGGRFALDYGQTAESIFPRIVPREETVVAGFHFAEETRYDPLTGRIENVFTFAREDARETKLASQRVYTLKQLVDLLRDAGLRTMAHFGSPSEQPFGLGSPRLLLVAEKVGSSV
jgi:SAM-dependent methyltransferase